MTRQEILEVLTDENGRFKHKVRQSIADRVNCTYATIYNVLQDRKVAISEEMRLKVLSASKDEAQRIKQQQELINKYEI